VGEEGRPVSPESIIRLPGRDGVPEFPDFEASRDDPFLRQVQASRRRWVLITVNDGPPALALDAPGFLRDVLFDGNSVDPRHYCHAPIVIRDRRADIGDVVGRLKAEPGDNVIPDDLIVVWGEQRRVITGADLFGYLMRGIARGTVAT